MQTLLSKRASALLVACTLVACGSGGGAAPKATTPAAPGAASAPAGAPSASAAARAGLALDLGEVTVYDGDEALFKLHADGTTELGDNQGGQLKWYPGPTFLADGTLLVEGETKARLTAEGIAIAGTDNVLPLAVTADTVSVDAISFSLAADGALEVSGLDTGSTKLRFEGSSPKALHTGLVVWTALFVLSQPVAPDGAAPAAAP
jgi:hypothetical protein